MSGDSWIKAQQDNSDPTLAKRERIDFSVRRADDDVIVFPQFNS